MIAFAVLLALYLVNKDKWQEQNVVARVWAPMEITTKMVEAVLYLYVRFAIDSVLPPELNSNTIEFTTLAKNQVDAEKPDKLEEE